MDQKDDMGGITIPTVTDDETSEPEALIGVCEFQSCFKKLESAQKEDFGNFPSIQMFLLKQSCLHPHSIITNLFSTYE